MKAFLLAIALGGLGSILAQAATTTRTEHYQIHSEGSLEEAEEMGRVLEAAWPHFKAFFKGTPIPRRDRTRLAVYFFNSQESWAAKLEQDGHPIPSGSVGGYYAHTNETAYLYRQPTSYYTRCLLLHEAAHQFHYLTRGLRQRVSANWYMEGVAEHLALHHWDGKTIELGVVPVSLEDYAGKALHSLKTTPRPLVAMINHGQENRPLGAMLCRYLIATQPSKFRRYARVLEQGEPSKLFPRFFGKLNALTPGFTTWLEAQQEPLTAHFNEWERLGSSHFLGQSPDRITLATFANEVTTIQSRISKQGGRAGLVLHYAGQEDFSVALLDSDGRFEVLKRKPGGWERLEQKPLKAPSDQGSLFTAKRSEEGVALRIDQESLGPYQLPKGSLGLAVDSGEVRFQDVRWK